MIRLSLLAAAVSLGAGAGAALAQGDPVPLLCTGNFAVLTGHQTLILPPGAQVESGEMDLIGIMRQVGGAGFTGLWRLERMIYILSYTGNVDQADLPPDGPTTMTIHGHQAACSANYTAVETTFDCAPKIDYLASWLGLVRTVAQGGEGHGPVGFLRADRFDIYLPAQGQPLQLTGRAAAAADAVGLEMAATRASASLSPRPGHPNNERVYLSITLDPVEIGWQNLSVSVSSPDTLVQASHLDGSRLSTIVYTIDYLNGFSPDNAELDHRIDVLVDMGGCSILKSDTLRNLFGGRLPWRDPN